MGWHRTEFQKAALATIYDRYDRRTAKMRLKEEQIGRLAENILGDLTKAGLISVKKRAGRAACRH